MPSPLEMAAGRHLPPALREMERRPRADRAHAELLASLARLDAAAPGRALRLTPAAWLNNTTTHPEVLAMFARALGA